MNRDPSNKPEASEWRNAYRELMASGSPECPGDEVLAAMASGEASSEERHRTADHIIGCRKCAADYRLLLDLHAEASGGRRRRFSRWLLPAVAAAGIGAVGVGLAWFRHLPVPPPAEMLRGATQSSPVQPEDGAELGEAPRLLAWPEQTGATGYRVRLFDESATVVWESVPLANATLLLAEEVTAQVRPGRWHFWTVEVGGPVARKRLGPYWFRVRG